MKSTLRRPEWSGRRAAAYDRCVTLTHERFREPALQHCRAWQPSRARAHDAVHDGAGQLDFYGLLDAHSLDTNLYFLHRGVIQSKSGIGAHFHCFRRVAGRAQTGIYDYWNSGLLDDNRNLIARLDAPI